MEFTPEEEARIASEVAEGEKADEEFEQDLVRAQAVKARLLNQLRTGYILVPFKDSGGEFQVKLRVPSPEERQRMWELTAEVDDATRQGDAAKLTRLGEKFADELAGFTPELDAEYWKKGKGFNVEVPQKLLRLILGVDPIHLEELSFFSGSLVGEDFAAMLQWIGLKGPSEWAGLADEDRLFWQSAWGRYKEGLKRRG